MYTPNGTCSEHQFFIVYVEVKCYIIWMWLTAVFICTRPLHVLKTMWWLMVYNLYITLIYCNLHCINCTCTQVYMYIQYMCICICTFLSIETLLPCCMYARWPSHDIGLMQRGLLINWPGIECRNQGWEQWQNGAFKILDMQHGVELTLEWNPETIFQYCTDGITHCGIGTSTPFTRTIIKWSHIT